MNQLITLPVTVPLCHSMIQSLIMEREFYKGKYQLAIHQKYGQSSEQIKYLESEIQGKIEDFNNNSKKVQLDLFTDIHALALEQQILEDKLAKEKEDALAKETQEVAQKPEKKERKKEYSTLLNNVEHLPKEICHHGQDLKSCPGCNSQDLAECSVEITKELELMPAKLIIKEHHTHKFICNNCNKFKRAEKPQQPIPKSMVGPNLLAYILWSRFDFFMPYYRLNREFKSYGVDISIANLCNWTNAVAEDIFSCLHLAIKEDIRKGDVVRCDETTFKEQAEKKCKIKYMWAFSSNVTKNVYFEFSNRSRETPLDFFVGLSKIFLLTDKYSGYDIVCKINDLIRAYCWQHAGRKFWEILKSCDDPNALPSIKNIYIEIAAILAHDKEIRKGPRGEILEKRNKIIKPLIESLFEKLEVMYKSNPIMPKSIRLAIEYLLKSPEEFKTFLLHPDLEPTNNKSEQIIRFFTLARKNFMFAGSDRGGQTTAIMCSVVASAEAHGLNVHAYLNYVITELPKTPQSEINKFLPQNCPQFQAKNYTQGSSTHTLNI